MLPRTHAHLSLFHEFAWLDPGEPLTRHERKQDTGHSLVSILAYLKVDLLSHTKPSAEDAICHAWDQIFTVEAPLPFTINHLIMRK